MGLHFWRYFLAQAVSSLGSTVGRLALSFLVYDLTDSEWAMGALLLVSAIPEIVLRLLGAPLIDRFPRLKLMAFLDFVRFVTYLIPWLFYTTGHPNVWVFFLQAFVTGLTGALYSPAAMAVIPSLVPEEKLVKANGMNMSFHSSLGLLGPMVAIAAVTYLGNVNAILLDGISFGLCGLALATLRVTNETANTNGGGLRGYSKDLVEGFAVFRQIPALLSITVVLAISNIGSAGSSSMLLPLIKSLGAPNTLLGSIETATAIGALAMTLFLSTFTLRIRRRYLMLSGLVFIQLAQLAGAFLPPNFAFLLAPAWALFAMGSNLYSAHSQTIYQQLVPDHLRGRAMSVRILVGQGMQPIGLFLGPLIATQWSPSMTLLLGGGIPLLITLTAFFWPSIQGLDRLDQPPNALNPPPAKQGAPAAATNTSQ